MNKRETAFVETVLTYYKAHGRHTLPWRQTTNPYRILVSEIMLQQTQVERVIPKYQAFIKRWPTVQKLANAPLRDVLIAWQGLGYNRRAKHLHQCANVVVREHKGVFPVSMKELQSLPGVGAYTAGAVMAFAYNIGVPLIETNVRTVYIHHFFKTAPVVDDADILKRVQKTLSPQDVRQWYAALMDYGSYLKRTTDPIHRRSRQYQKQSPFKGSVRAVRGAVLRFVTVSPVTVLELAKKTGETPERVDVAVSGLQKDGLVQVRRGRVMVR